MQIQKTNLVSFKGIERTIIPPCEFAKSGTDVARDILIPYLQSKSSSYSIFVGGPKFVELVTKMCQDSLQKAVKFFESHKISMPSYCSDRAPQKTYLVYGKSDLDRLEEFLVLRKEKDRYIRKSCTAIGLESGFPQDMAKIFGEFAAYMENTKMFETFFSKKIQDIDFGKIKSQLHVFFE